MALWVVTLVALLASLLILNDNGVYGGRSLSMEEDLELERQLKLLNKPAVKSIETEYGEIYDCIDFYKQPAFDNPLLKNHKPEMSSSIPRETLKEASPPSGVEHVDLKLDGGGCPSGAIPIRRTTKEDLIRWKSISNSSGNIHQFLYEGPGTHFAGFQVNENLKYHGASGRLSLHNPLVSANQYSGALVWVQGGQNLIQVGWHVNPKLYGDFKTHFFGYWTADGSKHTGCFNTICHGFIQVAKDAALGQAFRNTHDPRGRTYQIPTFLYQHKNSGNWWLALGNGITDIGYWPQELFNSITKSALVVGWRGEVYAPRGEQSPQMGTGKFPSDIDPYKTTAYFSGARVFNEAYIGVDPPSLEVVVDAPPCYSANYVHYDYDHYWRTTLYHGGPGGNC